MALISGGTVQVVWNGGGVVQVGKGGGGVAPGGRVLILAQASCTVSCLKELGR